MRASSTSLDLRQIPALLRGQPESIDVWAQRWETKRVLLYVAVIIVGTGVYGSAIGCWRAPTQAVYTAVKLPLILLLTTLGNALLNGMLAPLLGLNLTFRQSSLAILMSFTIAAAILAAFSPIMFFIVWNTPPLADQPGQSSTAFSFIQLTLVASIAFAGVVANLRLVQLLRRLSGSAVVARKILFAWLAGNLFLGSQLSWILRPFIGSPFLPVQFLRDNAFQGNFFETVFRSATHLLFN
jgi:hypothetical protein